MTWMGFWRVSCPSWRWWVFRRTRLRKLASCPSLICLMSISRAIANCKNWLVLTCLSTISWRWLWRRPRASGKCRNCPRCCPCKRCGWATRSCKTLSGWWRRLPICRRLVFSMPQTTRSPKCQHFSSRCCATFTFWTIRLKTLTGSWIRRGYFGGIFQMCRWVTNAGRMRSLRRRGLRSRRNVIALRWVDTIDLE